MNLSWTASTDNVGVTGYRVERCQGAGCTTFAQVGTPTATSFGDTGLSASTTYRYRVRAVDAAGNLSAYSAIATATTQAVADTTPPSAPTNPTASAVSSSQVNLSWTASTDNVAVTGYRVERCQGAGCTGFVQVGAPAVASFSDSGLAASTSYSYRMVAVDAAGNVSGYSTVASVATPAGPVLPAGLVAGYSFDAGSGLSVVGRVGEREHSNSSGRVLVDAGPLRRGDVVQRVEWSGSGTGFGLARVVGCDDVVGVDQSGGVAVGVADDRAASGRRVLPEREQ